MKRLGAILVLLMCLCRVDAQTIIKPSITANTSFAIVTDATSYQKAKDAINAYKQVVEKDGLATYIIYDDWKSPQQIRDIFVRLHQQKKGMLEGAVLVGDVPIAMLRDAQHLTSAFKMNQTRDWKESSVPSDRYYDDFGLKFKFIKQDADRKDYFYYSLLPESEQRINCDIYTARIRPLEVEGMDKYQQIKDFLGKVVRERTANAHNALNCLSMARGHGYNSEDETAWAGEQLALMEQMPDMFKAGHSIRFIDFESCYPAKNYYLNEVQRPDLDVMLFHHHGAPDTQYINGYRNGSDVNTSIENTKRFLRSKIPALAKKKGKEAAIDEYSKSYNVPRSWCEEAFDSTKVAADSIYNLDMDVITTDVRKLTPSARFIMFDACFNGSFYEKDYIAGSYLFDKGTTLVTQGNTVNTIQDKWPDELLGLLAQGMRIGEWHRHVAFLETHLLGDPTYHFTPTGKTASDINYASVVNAGNEAYWRSQLNNKNADIQSMAIRKLSRMKVNGLSGLLKQKYFDSPYMVVRLEAFRGLSRIVDNNFATVLRAALTDPYELTRRFAAKYVELYGSDDMVDDVARAFVTNYTDSRTNYNLGDAFQAFDKDKMKAALRRAIDARPMYYKKSYERWINRIDGLDKTRLDNLKEITDAATKEKRRISDIGYFRNHPSTTSIDALLKIVGDSTYSAAVRTATVEALGWYNMNVRKAYIIDSLNKISANLSDAALKSEITKSIRRLNNE